MRLPLCAHPHTHIRKHTRSASLRNTARREVSPWRHAKPCKCAKASAVQEFVFSGSNPRRPYLKIPQLQAQAF